MPLIEHPMPLITHPHICQHLIRLPNNHRRHIVLYVNLHKNKYPKVFSVNIPSSVTPQSETFLSFYTILHMPILSMS